MYTSINGFHTCFSKLRINLKNPLNFYSQTIKGDVSALSNFHALLINSIQVNPLFDSDKCILLSISLFCYLFLCLLSISLLWYLFLCFLFVIGLFVLLSTSVFCYQFVCFVIDKCILLSLSLFCYWCLCFVMGKFVSTVWDTAVTRRYWDSTRLYLAIYTRYRWYLVCFELHIIYLSISCLTSL